MLFVLYSLTFLSFSLTSRYTYLLRGVTFLGANIGINPITCKDFATFFSKNT